jgi:hypothetical protein
LVKALWKISVSREEDKFRRVEILPDNALIIKYRLLSLLEGGRVIFAPSFNWDFFKSKDSLFMIK